MGISKSTFYVLLVFLILIITLFFIVIYFQIKITSSKNGTSLVTSQATFFIPSNNPIKVMAFPTKPQELIDQIQNLTASSSATFGIYVKNLTTNQEVTINPDESFKTASLYKLGLMYTIYLKGSQGKLNINDPNIQSNLHAMITVSSNDAAYYLIGNYSNWSELDQVMHAAGLTNSNFKNDPPMSTPRDIEHLLELLASGEAIDQDTSLKMLTLMNEQQINDRIPVLLPKDAVIAHKTGELEDVRHDVGIIGDENNDFILVLMSKGSTNPESVKPIMSKISKAIYDYFHDEWKTTPEIL